MPQEEKKDTRTHTENLGNAWAVLVGNPQKLMPQIVGTILKAGGTRAPWKYVSGGRESLLMAWPADQPLRTAVVMQGEASKELKPRSAMPLLEGMPNDLTVEEVVPWKSGVEATVGACAVEGQKPFWFYCPTYFRDSDALTPGVQHSFLLSALAFRLGKALVDEITITEGPQYEEYAARWLAAHEGSSRPDVPPLKISIVGKDLVFPGRVFGEYQMRTTVRAVESCTLDKLSIRILTVAFPFENRPPLVFPVYVPAPVLNGYEPQKGDEIDMYVWTQGRIIDYDPTTGATEKAN